jgi:hypothetical protein
MASSKTSGTKYVCVISDATGATAERVVRATLAQFEDVDVALELVRDVKSVDQLREIVARTKARKGLVAYTLVEQTLRSEIASLANEAGVITVDLMGPLMTSLSSFLTAEPKRRPGLFNSLGEEHYRHLESVSFTVRHDDGLNISTIHRADLVIVGPSRTSKTPLSVYLTHTRGLKVANVPLALGVEPFEELRRLAPGQAIGLTMRADVLSQVRRQRLKDLGTGEMSYAGLAHVEKELHFCHEVYRTPPPWPVVDVTAKSIEEIAAEVCALTVDSRPSGRPAEERKPSP